MDQDPDQNIQTPEQIETPQNGPSITDKATDMGHSLHEGAKMAKDVLGKAAGGGGDGIGGGAGDALSKGLGALSGGKSGGAVGGLGKSLDGMKSGADKTPSMLRGMENDAKPHDPSSGEGGADKNPSSSDFAKKVGGATQKAGQAVDDAVKTAQDVQNVTRAVGSGGADVAADLAIAKELAAHPIATVKRYGRVGIYIGGFFAIQFLLVIAIVGSLFFGIYKVYLAGAEVWQDPTKIVTEMRVNFEMATYLKDAVTQLTYERSLANQSGSGVVIAAEQAPQKTSTDTSPETRKMHDAWSSADLAAKFIDEYGAEIKPTSGGGSKLSGWDLYVNGNNFGNLASDKAQAYIGVFTEDETHWNDIYTRTALKGVSKKSFGTGTFKLDLPNSEKNMDKSRENTTKQLVTSTLKPIEAKSETYYSCLIEGTTNCDDLGLGSTGSPDNNPSQANKGSGWLGDIIQTIRNNIATAKLNKKINKDNLGAYTTGVSGEITQDISDYKSKDELAANIRTGSSDTILRSIGKEDTNPNPDTKALLEMYDRFETSTGNGNFARVNYDRESQQGVALSNNYFVAGGQLLNNEMGLLDSWALTENLSILEESPIFRASVIGNPVGVFAQGGSADGFQECQKVYGDLVPVGKASENKERPVRESSCFRRSLLPDTGEFQQDKSLSKIYSLLEQKNDEADASGGGWEAAIAAIISGLSAQYVNNEVRASPVAAEEVALTSDLGPDFDAYTNKVYGVSRTGAEVNGEAFDTMKSAAESLWSQVGVDDQFGTGGSYQSDEEVAKTMQYAKRIEGHKLAFRPLSDRLFSLRTPDSLTAKLALLTPTNRGDSVNKTLALFTPTNLTGAIASRMTPTALAQATTDVNPLNAVRTGYSFSDPSNTMSGVELWDTYQCSTGGPTQETSKPEGIPFDIYSNTNPCKRESVIAKMTTCYFDSEDTCSLGTTQTSDSTAPGEISADSSGTPCYTGTEDLGIRDDAYTKGNRIKIRLCAVNSIAGTSEESTGKVPGANGRALVSSIASEAWQKLGELAKAQGVPLTAGSSWRTMAHQQQLCDDDDKCPGGDYNDVAKPGTSNHQAGTAIDISQIYQATDGPSSGRTCSNPQTASNATYVFVAANARTFGLKNYANEAWHWGTSESC